MEEIHCHGGVNKKMSDKILFQCDYNEGAHPKVLERLVQTNMEQTPGYSEDKYCEEARAKIRKACGDDSLAVHFLVGGTQTNVTVINAALRKLQGVLCAVTGHINVHETGAVEACGHKVLGLPSPDGKITAAQVAEAYEAHIHNDSFEHMVQPKMVYISNPTEVGTIYSKAELTALSETCHKYGLYLFLDGARLGYGLAAPDNDLTLPEIAALCDVFYIGGTKVGALFGEAVVIKNPELAQDFRYLIKQNGGMLAKGAFKHFARTIDYAEYGGAPLLGLHGLAIVCHGRSSARAMSNAIKMSGTFVRKGTNDRLAETILANEELTRFSRPI